MAEIRYNFQSGLLGNSLSGSSGSVAVTNLFAVAPGFATLVSPDYIKLVINNAEICYLVAYTSTSANGTIQRAQEGTSAIAVAAGTPWANAPTAQDFNAASVGSNTYAFNLVQSASVATEAYAYGITQAASIAVQTDTVLNASTSSTSYTINGLYGQYLITLTHTHTPTTFTLPTAVAGKSFVLGLLQDGTGGVTWTITGAKWPGGTVPTPTTAASALDVVTFDCLDGTHWLGSVLLNES